VLLPEGLFGLAAGPLVRALFGYFVSWVAGGAAALVTALGHVLQGTGGPDLGAPLQHLMGRTLGIGVALSLPLALLAVVQGVVRRDLGLVAGAVLVRLPLAALLGSVALVLVRLAVAATDSMTAALLDGVGAPVDGVFHGLAVALVATGSAGPGLPGFGVVMLAGVAAALAFLLWIELVVRAAAIEVATLFVPLALAGLVWPVTAHWARRLAEGLAALVLAKVVVAGVLALGVATLGSAAGVQAVVQGVALLGLGVLAPYAVLRLVPVVESGALGAVEGLGRRALRTSAAVASAAAAHLPSGGGPWGLAELLPPSQPTGAAGEGAGGGSGVDALGFLPSTLQRAATSPVTNTPSAPAPARR
jgi:hypothetical protein